MTRRQAGLLLATFLVVAAAGAFLLPRLNNPQPHVDESTYVNAVLDSIHSGHVLPRNPDGSPFSNKPPLHLWIVRAFFALFGPSFWSARLPSVLAMMLTAGLLFRAGARWVSPWAGALAVAFLFTAVGPLKEHGFRAATGDALLVLWFLVGIVALEGFRERPGRRTAVLVLASNVLSMATKGPWGPVLFLAYAVLTEFSAPKGQRFAAAFRRLLAGTIVVGAVSFALWLLCLASASEPGTVVATLNREYADRIAGQLEGAGYRGIFYLWKQLARDFGRWLVLPFLAFAVRRWSGEGIGARRWKLATWAILAPLLASFSRGQLPWYGYASYPGVALLLATSLDDLLGLAVGLTRRRQFVRAAACALALLGLTAVLPSRLTWGVAQARRRTQAERLLGILDARPGALVFLEPHHRRTLYADPVLREALFTLGKDPRTRWELPSVLPPCSVLVVRRPVAVASRYGLEPRSIQLSRVAGAPAILDACQGWVAAAFDETASPAKAIRAPAEK
jgi:4-amino-4-deoxy-L-arabinose transferase-like glycosyltransferase